MTHLETFVKEAKAYKEPLVPKGYTLSTQDIAWVRGLAEIYGLSESQILRGVIAQARDIEEVSK